MMESGADRRVHTRVQVRGEVRVSGPKGVATGLLRDLSKGGAGIYLPEFIGDVGESAELFLPVPGGVEIAVMADVLRIQKTSQGLLYGFRFALVEPALQDHLLKLIETLLTSAGSETRKHVRLSRRLPLKYGKLPEYKAMLENISIGGLAMTVTQPLVLYQEIEVSVPDLTGAELLLLKGRVVYQQQEEQGGKTEYRVGLEFKDLSFSAKSCLEQLLKHVLEIRDPRTT